MSGAQISRFSTLVRTLRFNPVRILSADIFQRKVSCSSKSSRAIGLPAQGMRMSGLPAVPLVMHVSLANVNFIVRAFTSVYSIQLIGWFLSLLYSLPWTEMEQK